MRPAFAAILGITITLVLAFVGELATTAMLAAPDGAPLPVGRTFFAAMLAIAFGTAVVGGFVGAHASKAHRGRVALAVAAGVAAFGVLSAVTAATGTPPAFAWTLPVVAAVGALAGGGIRVLNRSSGSPVSRA